MLVNNIEEYKGYKIGDEIHYIESVGKEQKIQNFVGKLTNIIKRENGFIDVEFINEKNKPDTIIGYFVTDKKNVEAQLEKERKKVEAKKISTRKKVEKMKATVASKKANKAQELTTAFFNKEIKIPGRVTLVFINKILGNKELRKTDSANYYVLVDGDQEIGIYFKGTMKAMVEVIITSGVRGFIDQHTY